MSFKQASPISGEPQSVQNQPPLGFIDRSLWFLNKFPAKQQNRVSQRLRSLEMLLPSPVGRPSFGGEGWDEGKGTDHKQTQPAKGESL